MKRSPILLLVLVGMSCAVFQTATGNGYGTEGARLGMVRGISGDNHCVVLQGDYLASECTKADGTPVPGAVPVEQLTAAGDFGGQAVGGALTMEEVADLWVRHGGAPSQARTAAAVASAESGRRPTAVNASNTNGSVDRGLFQMNTIHDTPGDPLLPGPPCSTFDLNRNVECAVHLQRIGGWTHWVAHDTGAYLRFL